MLSLILVITNSKTQVSQPHFTPEYHLLSVLVSGVIVPITSQMAVSHLIPSPCAPAGEQDSDLAWKEL